MYRFLPPPFLGIFCLTRFCSKITHNFFEKYMSDIILMRFNPQNATSFFSLTFKFYCPDSGLCIYPPPVPPRLLSNKSPRLGPDVPVITCMAREKHRYCVPGADQGRTGMARKCDDRAEKRRSRMEPLVSPHPKKTLVSPLKMWVAVDHRPSSSFNSHTYLIQLFKTSRLWNLHRFYEPMDSISFAGSSWDRP